MCYLFTIFCLSRISYTTHPHLPPSPFVLPPLPFIIIAGLSTHFSSLFITCQYQYNLPPRVFFDDFRNFPYFLDVSASHPVFSNYSTSTSLLHPTYALLSSSRALFTTFPDSTLDHKTHLTVTPLSHNPWCPAPSFNYPKLPEFHRSFGVYVFFIVQCSNFCTHSISM